MLNNEEIEALRPVWKLLSEREQKATMRANNSAAQAKVHAEALAELLQIAQRKGEIENLTDGRLS